MYKNTHTFTKPHGKNNMPIPLWHTCRRKDKTVDNNYRKLTELANVSENRKIENYEMHKKLTTNIENMQIPKVEDPVLARARTRIARLHEHGFSDIIIPNYGITKIKKSQNTSETKMT